MEDKIESKLKELLPYIIVAGILFLLLPLLMGSQENAVTYVIQLGAFPLISLGCGFHYAYRKHKKDIAVCCIAPVFYAITALLYGMWSSSWITVLIYIAAYFICGYLGMMLCDLVVTKGAKGAKSPKSRKSRSSREEESAPARQTPRPARVDVKKHDEPRPTAFKTEDPADDSDLDTSTTDDDIEAILNAIHSRKNQ